MLENKRILFDLNANKQILLLVPLKVLLCELSSMSSGMSQLLLYCISNTVLKGIGLTVVLFKLIAFKVYTLKLI